MLRRENVREWREKKSQESINEQVTTVGTWTSTLQGTLWGTLLSSATQSVATGLKKVSFHSSLKEGQCQRMWTDNFHMYNLGLEKSEEPGIKLPTFAGSWEKQGDSRKTFTSASLTTLNKAFDCVDHNKLWKILKEMGIPNHLICLLRDLYEGQEATVRTEYETTDWCKIGKGVCQGCILSPCLFNLHAEYIMQNARLDESQARIKISGRNINNLRYADNTTLMAESEEELKSLLMRVKEESEKADLKLNIQKTKIMASGPITLQQIYGEKVEAGFLFLDSKITVDSDCSHGIFKRCLLLGRKAITNLDSILKSRDIALLTKVCIVKTTVFPVVMYGCESWSIKKAECWRIDAFELWCWRRFLRVPCTASRSNQSVLKEINPEYSLKGLVLKLKFQYLGHLMQSWLTGKDPDAWEDRRQKEKGVTKDEIVR